MANYIDPYDPIFYAQEALKVLEQCLGMAGRIHTGYDAERKSVDVGSTIEIKKPGTFSTQAGGTGTVNDVETTKISLEMDTWREVKFGLTDKELAYTSEKIITDHISPAVYAIAHYIETTLTNLYVDCPWSYDIDSSPGANDIVDARKVMRDNAGPLIDQDIIHFGIDSTLEAAFLKSTLFHSASVAGDNQNLEALKSGSLGTRFGVESFVQQTLTDHTSGTVVSAGTDVLGSLKVAGTKRDTTINLENLSLVETLAAGDSFVIAGNTQRYVVTSATTLAAGAHTAVPIYPQLAQDYLINAVVTFETIGASNFADRHFANIMFHKNAFALAMAPLPEIGDGAGAKMAVIQDPRTGLSMRSRMAYDDTNAKVVITLDVLYGVKTLDSNLAVICRRNYA
jgi:coat protein Gp5